MSYNPLLEENIDFKVSSSSYSLNNEDENEDEYIIIKIYKIYNKKK